MPRSSDLDAARIPSCRVVGGSLALTARLAPMSLAIRVSLRPGNGEAVDAVARPTGRRQQAVELQRAAQRLAHTSLDVIVADLPLSHAPITGRRPASRTVSSTCGGRGPSTHSPSQDRPGPISERRRETAGRSGYPLATTSRRQAEEPRIATATHPADSHLTSAGYRAPCVSQRRQGCQPDLPHLKVLQRQQTAEKSRWPRCVARMTGGEETGGPAQ